MNFCFRGTMLSGTRQVSGPDVWCDEHLKDFTLAMTLLHCQKHSTVKCREIPVSDGEDTQLLIWNISSHKETVKIILSNYWASSQPRDEVEDHLHNNVQEEETYWGQNHLKIYHICHLNCGACYSLRAVNSHTLTHLYLHPYCLETTLRGGSLQGCSPRNVSPNHGAQTCRLGSHQSLAFTWVKLSIPSRNCSPLSASSQWQQPQPAITAAPAWAKRRLNTQEPLASREEWSKMLFPPTHLCLCSKEFQRT